MSGATADRGSKGSRFAAIAIVLGIAAGGLLGIAARNDDGDEYLVRAVFDNGSFVIAGEDVKVAGVKVGTIHDIDLTEDNKAAVVLRIDDPAFVPFRKDAECQIRLQSLIGEQFVECKPTQARKTGEEAAPPLDEVEEGRGEGQHLLPVDNNITPVGTDLLGNIPRMPQREGFRLILNELGAGLAGNGERLQEAVRRANPALKETDRVIKILADQDRLLARLVDESDQALEPWAKRRRETAGFIREAGATAAASAEEGDNIERNFERLPGFLREFQPTMDAFSGLADQMTPALNSLDSEGEAISEVVQRLGPFTKAATPALVGLGDFADKGRRLFPAIEPLARNLRDLGRPLRPTADDLAKLLNSFDETGGIENLMQLIYFYTGTVNGKDQFGHYARAALALTPCVPRSPTYEESCASTLGDPVGSSAALSAKNLPEALQSRDASVIRKDAEAIGMTPDSPGAEPLLDYLLAPDPEGSER